MPLFLLAAGLLLLAAPAGADLLIPRDARGVTVEFTDGRRLEGVDVAWEPRERTLAITREGVTMHAGTSEIAAIRDATGADITANLIPRQPAPRSTAVPPPVTPPVTTPVQDPVTDPIVIKSPPPAEPVAASVPPAEPAGPGDGRRFAVAITPVAGQGWLSHDAWFGGQEAESRFGLRLRVAATPALYFTTEYTRQDLDDTDGGVAHLDMLAFGLGLRPDIGSRIRAWPFLELSAGMARPAEVRANGPGFAHQTQPLLQARVGLMLPVIPRLEVELSGCSQLTGEDFGDTSLGSEGGLIYGAEIGVTVLLGP
jgi:hypothetical protein